MAVPRGRAAVAAVRCPDARCRISSKRMHLSIIIPCLNEQDHIVSSLTRVQTLRRSAVAEVIVVDGGSCDNTVQLAKPLVDRLIHSTPGRALQMNRGAAEACGDWLLFLHADTLVPDHFESLWQRQVASSDRVWGRFDLRLSGTAWPLRVVESLINLRSRISGIATGDQGIFIRAGLFRRLGGFAAIPLMEDVELSKRLKREGRPLCIASQLVTSSRHWEQCGILKTVLLMWKLRFLYFAGVSPQRLAAQYYRRERA